MEARAMTSFKGFNSCPRDGFSLVELLLVLVLVSIFGTLTYTQLKGTSDAGRFEVTRSRLDAIRVAVQGDTSVDKEGHRRHFGYHGDMGRLPSTLTELVTRGAQPAWAFNTYYGVGAGWRGPYVSTEVVGDISIDKDAWGNTFIYNTAPDPATVTSLGADRAVGGVLYANDQTLNLPVSERHATLSGVLADGDTRIASSTVEIRRPVNGTLTATNTVTTASGYFTFSSIPYGVRSLELRGTNLTDGPKRFVVEKPIQDVPPGLTDTAGRLQSVTTVGAPTNPCGSSTCVRQVLQNRSQTTLVFEYLTINWDRRSSTTEGFAQKIVFNGLTQLFPPVPPATRVYFPNNVAFTANTTRTFEIHFVSNVNGTGTTNVSNTRFYIDFEWVGGKRDNVFFQTP